MEPEKFKQVTNDILTNLNDQAKVTEMLTTLQETYETTHTTSKTLDTKQKDYEKEIQALKDTNMNLFLKLNTQPQSNNSTTNNENTKKEPLTYKNLLNEMGVK